MTRFIIFLFITLNIITLKLNAECNYVNSENVKTIEIIFKNNKKFFSEIAKALTSTNSNLLKNKKNYKAKIIINHKNKESCELLSKIKLHGDFLDHIENIDGYIIPSLRVNLKNGNFNGITEFILLRPKTRYFDNEIFVTTLFKFLGFLSPRTFYVNVKIGNKVIPYIFQESLKKEFLENNNLVEGPIIRLKEDFSTNHLEMSRIENAEWIKDNYNKFQITLNALGEYNLNVLYSYTSKIGMNEDETIKFKNPKSENLININRFDALMYAVGAAHGLSYDDRRLYYHNIYSKFEPIYYDGMSNILSSINYNPYNGKYEKIYFANWKKLDELFLEFEKNYTREPSKKYSNPAVSITAFEGAESILIDVQKINKSQLLMNLKKNGLKDFTEEQLTLVLDKIILRLKTINNHKNNLSIGQSNLDKQVYSKYKNQMKLNNQIKLYFLIKDNIFKKNFDLKKIEICSYDLLNCTIKKIDNEKLYKLINQNSFNNDQVIFLAITKDQYMNNQFTTIKNDLFNSFKKTNINNQIKILYNEYVNLFYDQNKNLLEVNFSNNSGRVLIYESILNNIEISINNLSQKNNNNFNNIFNITGCFTILDSSLQNLVINASNLNCEDSINILRSKGTIKDLKIFNSNSDGLDIDFSSISIDQLLVENSLNDCADFSFGNYLINNARLQNCGDKAVSVGERSMFEISKLDVTNSFLGIASKDSSFVKIDQLNIKNVNDCIAAYKKKQEFGYSNIFIKNFDCDNYVEKILVDDGSVIEIINEL